eukprot:754715-Amphidinium_carterae.1
MCSFAKSKPTVTVHHNPTGAAKLPNGMSLDKIPETIGPKDSKPAKDKRKEGGNLVNAFRPVAEHSMPS